MRTLFAVGAFAMLAACGPARPAGPTPEVIAANSQKLTDYLNAEFEEEVGRSPELATSLSRKDNYDRLDDYSEAGKTADLEWRRESVAGMKSQFDRAALNADAQTSFDIWSMALDEAELAAKFRRQDYIFGYGGPHTDLPGFLISYHKVDEVADMEAYIKRISAVGVALDQVTERAMLAAADGIRAPKFGYDRTLAESEGMISGAPFGPGPDTALWEDAKAKIKALADAGKATPEQAKALEDAAKTALINDVKPPYERLTAWLKADGVNAPSGKVGALTLPEGVAWYNAALKLNTTTDMTADEIHELGLSEVKRIHAEMEKIREQVGFKGDLKAFFEFMRNDKQFYLPNTDAGRAEYLAKADGYLAAMKAKLPDYFGRLPKAALEVRRVEAFREQPGGAAHYYAPTPDGKAPGIFYAHLSDMSAVSLWALESLAYHEGVPGHHMQIAIAQELTDVPLFRTVYGYTAFAEGWGLYAEDLGKEMGFFTDPYNDFGRLSSELWRSVRLVADTGLHAKGWTEEETVQWALANSPRPESSVRSEVRRFLLMPGQATAYKIGMIKIQKLRDEAKAALGDAFDLRGFHDTVIGGGSMPLSVLETRVKAWAAGQERE